ncbi:regulatory protein RecX [Altererythrobacter fulvus]|uniref:regulatory protein RecX n=1 Tax=Caenibius fulvus TaxID=2126012 RepID=UPI003015EA47
MQPDARHNPRQKRLPRPLDRARMEEMALAYVARFATSAAKLEAYLKRKLRERGWDGEGQPDVAALVGRYVELGYIDDETYARAKAGGLLRRGYGPRRVSQALGAAGIAEDIRESVQASEAEERRAALALARKRRFGPFGAGVADRAMREKQIAAMLRAGHALDSARELVDAPSAEAAEQWAAAGEEEEGS